VGGDFWIRKGEDGWSQADSGVELGAGRVELENSFNEKEIFCLVKKI
jgi:hypothetical protein